MMITRALIVLAAFTAPGCVSHPWVQEIPPSFQLQQGRFTVSSSASPVDLTVMVSSTDLCDRSKIDQGQQLLTVRVEVPLPQDLVPGAYSVGASAPARVVLSTANKGCAGGTAGTASTSGTVTITTVNAQLVEGSFDGWGADLHLFGSFRATPCANPGDTCTM
jgi:hypothetical protein